jgi:hypothetical protein
MQYTFKKILLALRLVAFFGSAMIAVIGVGGSFSLPAFAAGGGRVCIFFAPSGGGGLGHVGWAFQDGVSDHWYYGATENTSGQAVTSSSGAWMRDGTKQVMLETFAGQLDPVKSLHPGQQYYTQYRCKSTASSNVAAAVQTAQKIPQLGYNVVYNEQDCLTQAQMVLESYDSSVFAAQPGWIPMTTESGQEEEYPEYWFPELDRAYGFELIQPLNVTS